MVFGPSGSRPSAPPAATGGGRLEDAGLAPRRILLGPRRIAWRLSDLLGWIDERAAVVDTPEARRRRAPQVPGAPDGADDADEGGTMRARAAALDRTRRGTEGPP